MQHNLIKYSTDPTIVFNAAKSSSWLGSSMPYTIFQFWGKSKNKEWVIKQTNLEGMIHEYEECLKKFDQNKRLKSAQKLCATLIRFCVTTIQNDSLTLQEIQEIFFDNTLLIERFDEISLSYKPCLDEKNIKLLKNILNIFYQNEKWIACPHFDKTLFNRYINRLKSYEVIANSLNRDICQRSQLKTLPPKNALVKMNNETCIVSRLMPNPDLFSFVTSMKNNPAFMSDTYSFKGFYQAIVIRLVFGDNSADIKLENMLMTREGVVNIDTGNFFQNRFSLVNALSASHILDYFYGGDFNNDDEIENDIYFSCVTEFAKYFGKEEKIKQEIMETLKIIDALSREDFESYLTPFNLLKEQNEFFFHPDDAQYVMNFMLERQQQVKKILISYSVEEELVSTLSSFKM